MGGEGGQVWGAWTWESNGGLNVILKEPQGAGMDMRGSVLVRGFDARPFWSTWGPGGIGSASFYYVRPRLLPIIPVMSLFHRCGCAAH